jgi:tetrahydromethanopterin S-methyltransferase subunit E
VLFLYGLEAFSHEIQAVGGESLKKWLGRLTENQWIALLLGAVVTAIVQSSSAVTSLTVALVDAGTISFRFSLGVLLRKKQKHVARVVLARKLFIAVYALLHDGVMFDENKFAAR